MIAALFILFVVVSVKSFASTIQYNGDVSFKAETNMPGMNIEGNSKTFKTLKADFSDDQLQLISLEAVIDAETLKTGIDMRDQHMYEKVFMVLSGKEKPTHLKMTMNKSTCVKNGETLTCSGSANFTLGKKNFSRKFDLKFDKNLNTDVAFNLSLKELAIEIPSYLGIELEDSVVINMKALKK
jgi:polyisoprenoid-binding protein YceI